MVSLGHHKFFKGPPGIYSTKLSLFFDGYLNFVISAIPQIDSAKPSVPVAQHRADVNFVNYF